MVDRLGFGHLVNLFSRDIGEGIWTNFIRFLTSFAYEYNNFL